MGHSDIRLIPHCHFYLHSRAVHPTGVPIDDPAVAHSVGLAGARLGILPLGGAFESRNDWERVLADLTRSPSGFMVPQLQRFLPHHIAMETRLRSEVVGVHQVTALAVANGKADVATNNTADLERFTLQFRLESVRLLKRPLRSVYNARFRPGEWFE